MPAQEEERRVGTQLDLNLVEYQVRGGSMGYGPEGGTFACIIGPVSDETLAALDRAAENHGTIRLLLPQPLVLDLVSLERKEPHGVRIVGRIVDPRKAAE